MGEQGVMGIIYATAKNEEYDRGRIKRSKNPAIPTEDSRAPIDGMPI